MSPKNFDRTMIITAKREHGEDWEKLEFRAVPSMVIAMIGEGKELSSSSSGSASDSQKKTTSHEIYEKIRKTKMVLPSSILCSLGFPPWFFLMNGFPPLVGDTSSASYSNPKTLAFLPA